MYASRIQTSHRKAKNRSIYPSLQNNGDLDEPFIDSDSDPVWSPQKGDDDDDDIPRRKNKRKSKLTNKTNSKRSANNKSDDINIEYFNVEQKSINLPLQSSDDFKTGDFIVSQQDVFLDWPAIWRVDSKMLLQKFEPFQRNNKTIYRSLSTYAQWTSANRGSYILVKCIHVGQLQNEMHVELQRNELFSATSEIYIEKVMNDTLAYQDQFEVYVQTLISQALDANFLTEIMQEQDDYFLSNVKIIDDLSNERSSRLRNCMRMWSMKIIYSIETWPCCNIINDLGNTNNGHIMCAGCNKRQIVSRVILYGQPYNPSNISPIQLDNRFDNFEKDFLLCQNCIEKCELFHKVAHQKYLMYMECSKKVIEKNGLDPNKGTTIILNELLADESWLNQLFKSVRQTWAQIDQIHRQSKS